MFLLEKHLLSKKERNFKIFRKKRNKIVKQCLFVFLDVADDYNRIGSSLYALGTQDSTDICK